MILLFARFKHRKQFTDRVRKRVNGVTAECVPHVGQSVEEGNEAILLQVVVRSTDQTLFFPISKARSLIGVS